jgi:CRISPR-associated protein Csh1
MIKELINFTDSLDADFKTLGSKPKEGLHIFLDKIIEDSGNTFIDVNNFTSEIYSKKSKEEISYFLNKCKWFQQNSWCIDTNKCFDLPTKAIHTCSPFCVAFKREHLKGGEKYLENESGKKNQIYDRFNSYFEKAFALFEDEDEKFSYEIFKLFFTHNTFSNVLDKIEENNLLKRENLESKIQELKELQKQLSDKNEKEELKNKIADLEQEALKYKKLEDSDYVVFYLNVPIEDYIRVHSDYLADKLFNKNDFNTPLNEKNKIYGVSGFYNSIDSGGKKPFLLHQTASFDITGRISNIDAKTLFDFENLLPNQTLPSPLPIFIYKQEILNEKVIGLFKESGYKMGYKELIEKLLIDYQDDLNNYYLLFWQYTKNGIVFRDFDFVSKFEYEEQAEIKNLFELNEKDNKGLKFYPKITNVFEFEFNVFKPLLQNKYLNFNYFSELNKEEYAKLDNTFISFSKYRKAVYDYVYKSQRQTIDGKMFDEMVFNGIKDDIKQNNGYGVKTKLNIWYSLYEHFNSKSKNIKTMASELKSYQKFVEDVTNDAADLANSTDKQFAFVAGQVIYYILEKSKSGDNSYQLLEPYLQQSKCSEFKKAIANDFARYKHENFSKNYERAASFVLSYQTEENMKHLLPEILSGVFAKNQLFSNKSN